MIRIEDIFVVFFSGTPLERIALRGVNFKVEEGEIVSVVGSSGSGRSTLIKFLSGQIKSSFGRLWYNKEDITGQSFSRRSKIFSSISYDCDTATAGGLTVAENLLIASMHHQDMNIIRPAMSQEKHDMFYEQLRELNFMNIEDLIDEKVSKISRPHRQILALLMAVMKETKVLLIDEYSTGLDEESSARLREATEKIIKSKKITTIITSGDPKGALNMSDKIVILRNGQVIGEVSGEEKKDITIEDLYDSLHATSFTKKVRISKKGIK